MPKALHQHVRPARQSWGYPTDEQGHSHRLDARLATANVKLKLDVNVGDPVTPGPRLIALPSQRPGYPPVSVMGYPIETVCAEKAATAIALGAANSRVRDFVDLYALTGKYSIEYAEMRAALDATPHYREVTLVRHPRCAHPARSSRLSCGVVRHLGLVVRRSASCNPG